MTNEKKKWIVLGCLVLLWAILMVIQRSETTRTRPTEGASVPRRGTVARRVDPTVRVRTQGKQPGEMPRLEFDRLERARPPFEPEARNIFAAIEPSSAFPSASPGKPQVAPTPPPPPPPDPFIEASKRVHFLGYAEADGKARAFLSYDGELLVVAETEVFGDLFQVREVHENTLVLNSTDGTKEVRLELGPAQGGTLPHRRDERGKEP